MVVGNWADGRALQLDEWQALLAVESQIPMPDRELAADGKESVLRIIAFELP
jgi:hypothetical protein